MKMRKALTVALTAAALGMAGVAACADSPQNRPDSGAGWGPGMMGGYGPGWGRGDGMMRGYDALSTLNLTVEQRKKIEEIQESTRKEQWEITGKMLGESDKLRDLLAADPLDRAATDAQYEKLQALRKQRFDIALESRKKVMDALTTEQRERMRHYGPWWMQGGGD